MRSPVLLLIFNRPETTARVFEAVRAAQPRRLYVAADGPRPDRDGEARLCEQARQVATNVDWDCELKTLFQSTNLGCGLGPVRGIDWFFREEREGIILEDDILPVPTFFPYCDRLLKRFRDDERVGVIGGSNPLARRFSPQESYFFSRHIRIWGWASWRRVWRLYDYEMRAWPGWRDAGGLLSVADGSKLFESHWRKVFDRTWSGPVNWWDYQLSFTCWSHGLLGILPAHSQIHNVGFGPGATHTVSKPPAYLRETIPKTLAFPLRHPARVARNPAVDRAIDKDVAGLTITGNVRRQLRRIKPLLRRAPIMGDLLKSIQRWAQAPFSSR
jgi:hypothetical protein